MLAASGLEVHTGTHTRVHARTCMHAHMPLYYLCWKFKISCRGYNETILRNTSIVERKIDFVQHNLVNPGPDPEVLNAAFPGRLESLLNWRRDSLFEGTSVVSDHVLVMQLHVQPQAGPCHSSTKFSLHACSLPAPGKAAFFLCNPLRKKKDVIYWDVFSARSILAALTFFLPPNWNTFS